MKVLYFLILFTLLFSRYAHAHNYYFFVNGDFDYFGPTLVGKKIKLEDQSKNIYRDLVEQAKADSENTYVIFYDPRGKGSFLNRKKVKLEIYKKGKNLLNESRKEINTASLEAFQWIAKESKPFISIGQKTLVYYYGEHVSLRPSGDYDFSHPQSQFDLKSFSTGLGTIAKNIDLLVLHTCYMNHMKFFESTKGIVQNYLIPKKAILNTPYDLKALTGKNDLRSIQKELKLANGAHPKYPLVSYGKEVARLLDLFKRLEGYTSKELYNSQRVATTAKGYQDWLQRVSQQSILLPLTSEAFLPLVQYLSLLDQYLLKGEFLLDQVDQLLDQYPELENTYGLIHKL